MTEKEQLIQNLNGAMPIAKQMRQIEGEVEQIEEQMEKRKKFWGRMRFAAIIPFIFAMNFQSEILLYLTIGFFVYTCVMKRKDLKNGKQKTDALYNQFALLQRNPNLAWLHDMYRTPGCIFKIFEYVNAGRADSMKEALNILEEEIHRQEMKDVAAIGAFYGARSGRS